MSWTEAMAGFDIESTSPLPEEARIVTATVVRVQGSQISARNWIVNPGIPIPPEATAIHGITDDEAREFGVDPATAAAQILAELDECWSLGMPVVGHNISYDVTVLDRELRRHCGTEFPVPGPLIDTLVLDKQFDRYRRGRRTLEATAQHYGVRLDAAHSATEDALAACRIAWKLSRTFPGVGADLIPLQLWQAEWHAEQQASLAEHFRSQGKDFDLDDGWPIRTYRGERVSA